MFSFRAVRYWCPSMLSNVQFQGTNIPLASQFYIDLWLAEDAGLVNVLKPVLSFLVKTIIIDMQDRTWIFWEFMCAAGVWFFIGGLSCWQVTRHFCKHDCPTIISKKFKTNLVFENEKVLCAFKIKKQIEFFGTHRSKLKLNAVIWIT